MCTNCLLVSVFAGQVNGLWFGGDPWWCKSAELLETVKTAVGWVGWGPHARSDRETQVARWSGSEKCADVELARKLHLNKNGETGILNRVIK